MWGVYVCERERESESEGIALLQSQWELVECLFLVNPTIKLIGSETMSALLLTLPPRPSENKHLKEVNIKFGLNIK